MKYNSTIISVNAVFRVSELDVHNIMYLTVENPLSVTDLILIQIFYCHKTHNHQRMTVQLFPEPRLPWWHSTNDLCSLSVMSDVEGSSVNIRSSSIRPGSLVKPSAAQNPFNLSVAAVLPTCTPSSSFCSLLWYSRSPASPSPCCSYFSFLLASTSPTALTPSATLSTCNGLKLW